VALRDHLTKPQGDVQAAREMATHRGQAHWALTGPEGTTCRECAFWSMPSPPEGPRWPRYKRDGEGNLKRRRCRKFRTIAYGREGEGIPHYAYSCKFFVPVQEPAPISPQPRKRGKDVANKRAPRKPKDAARMGAGEDEAGVPVVRLSDYRAQTPAQGKVRLDTD
jgi:hypothetical protein